MKLGIFVIKKTSAIASQPVVIKVPTQQICSKRHKKLIEEHSKMETLKIETNKNDQNALCCIKVNACYYLIFDIKNFNKKKDEKFIQNSAKYLKDKIKQYLSYSELNFTIFQQLIIGDCEQVIEYSKARSTTNEIIKNCHDSIEMQISNLDLLIERGKKVIALEKRTSELKHEMTLFKEHTITVNENSKLLPSTTSHNANDSRDIISIKKCLLGFTVLLAAIGGDYAATRWTSGDLQISLVIMFTLAAFFATLWLIGQFRTGLQKCCRGYSDLDFGLS